MIFLFQDQPYGDTGGAAAAGLGIGFMIVWLAFMLLIFALMWWKVFVKAGKPGWASIVPIYNFVVLFQISGKPAWWVILLIVPVVNFIIIIIQSIALAKKFGKDTGYGLGLAFLGIIFYPMLGFGDAQYDPNAAT
ncbi:MAG TPA: DUF5684 domain-containing protein [Thermoanaerobaculia bacterium]|jgi:hypothetical protein|nr:DUF5684 domain-containing protein [Thermoanaerobaculia bacterium]